MAIRITRVYTRTGDQGETALVGGRRVPKDSPRIEAYGTLDELNSVLGLARVFNAEQPRARRRAPPARRDPAPRSRTSSSTSAASSRRRADAVYEGMFRVSDEEVTALERLMDECQKELTPLKSFVLPGRRPVSGFLHQARTVCRRAEREILASSRSEHIGEWPLTYVNRLSDLLFVLSRWTGKHLGEPSTCGSAVSRPMPGESGSRGVSPGARRGRAR